MAPDLHSRLRSLPVFGDSLPGFDPATAPLEPLELLLDWLESAIEAKVAVPHAMTLATADRAGSPSARTLLLKDLTDEGLWFATSASSRKGTDLAANPRAAAVLFWRELGRQVRVEGTVSEGSRDHSEADFVQRHPNARATAIAGTQSQPMPPEYPGLLAEARQRMDAEPGLVPESWSTYSLSMESVEFWQAGRDREVVRLRYTRHGAAWRRDLLWP